jgi:hydroxyacylglutathione hydrolase
MALHFECVVVGPFQENTWIVGDDETGDAILVDPGNFDDRESQKVEAALTRHGLAPKAIVNTHGHIDHIAGIHRVKARYHVPLYIHPGEKMWIEQVTQQCALFGFPPIPEPEVDGWLEDGQVLDVGSLEMEIRQVPGHTPGGCVLVFPGHVITGDTLFAGSIGRTDFPGGSFEALEQGIKARLYTLPDDTVVHSGHGPDTTIGREKATNPFVRG